MTKYHCYVWCLFFFLFHSVQVVPFCFWFQLPQFWFKVVFFLGHRKYIYFQTISAKNFLLVIVITWSQHNASKPIGITVILREKMKYSLYVFHLGMFQAYCVPKKESCWERLHLGISSNSVQIKILTRVLSWKWPDNVLLFFFFF